MKITVNFSKSLAKAERLTLQWARGEGNGEKRAGLQSGPALELHLLLHQVRLEMLSAQFTLTWTLSMLPLWTDTFIPQQWHRLPLTPAVQGKGICRDKVEGGFFLHLSPSKPWCALSKWVCLSRMCSSTNILSTKMHCCCFGGQLKCVPKGLLIET